MTRAKRQGAEATAPRSLGADLRAIRKGRRLTLTDMAEALDRSVGWVSQVERDISTPSISDLRRMAEILDVPVSLLFGEATVTPEERGYVVRAGARRAMGSAANGLTEELLSPDLTDSFEVIHSTFAAYSGLEAPVMRETQEVGFVISGRLNLKIAERSFTVCPGDSFRIRGEYYTWDNPYNVPAVVVWVISPPVY
ncbi:helix-turn-helix domain-containing protein [Sulfitobacter sp. D7]|jgi:transcriptional regulator with XRE-family HTH domain|uniref:helix-turn-helix domain-containing protein n=1 Tax=Sulfitobacter sp. D7 TaxID=1968541 RepID=UPI000E77AD7A|nr:XRE family transcriptional regulator [Sulfitobacter sp. D7]AYE86313.1 XRE family transcriptional regulator [Sulfitobacter sp. D7]